MRKLRAQFAGGIASEGGERLYDTVGAGSKDFGKDGRKESGGWDGSARGRGEEKGLMREGWGDIGSWVIRGEKKGDEDRRKVKRLKLDPEQEEAICIRDRDLREAKVRRESPPPSTQFVKKAEAEELPDTDLQRNPRISQAKKTQVLPSTTSQESDRPTSAQAPHPPTPTPPTPTAASDPSATDPASTAPLLSLPPTSIFNSLTLFILGSTFPLVSDHALKHLFTSHGGSIALGLARKRVTHVVVGGGEAGGGALAASKIQKEAKRVGGKSLKFVKVDWVLESVRNGRRLTEGGFAVEGLGMGGSGGKGVLGAGTGQRSVVGMF